MEHCVVQRLLAQPIARQEQFAVRFVVNGEGEHAAQLLNAVGSHLLIEVNNNFGIRLRVEAMTAALEFSAEFGKIIDFPVVDNPRTPVFVKHRLMTAGKVNNAEAPHSETGTVLNEDTFIVGATVDDAVAHLPHETFGDVVLPSCAYNSGNSAHMPVSILSYQP